MRDTNTNRHVFLNAHVIKHRHKIADYMYASQSTWRRRWLGVPLRRLMYPTRLPCDHGLYSRVPPGWRVIEGLVLVLGGSTILLRSPRG